MLGSYQTKKGFHIYPSALKLTLLFAILIFGIFSILIGAQNINFKHLFDLGSEEMQLIYISRIPRTVTLILTGAGLAICGSVLQQLSQNKFISPTTSGTLDAAKLGILFGIFLIPNSGILWKLIFGVIFCFGLTLLFTLSISRLIKRHTVLIPILGVMYGYTLNSVANMFGVEMNIVQNMESWMVGSFAKTLKGQYEIIYLLFPLLCICYLYAYRFSLAAMGREFSTVLGLNYHSIMVIGLILTSLMVSITILAVGSIPFLDLVIPNLVSVLHGDNARKNLPFTAGYGSLTLLICDILGRVIIFPYEIPVSLIVGSLGALIFILILIKRNR